MGVYDSNKALEIYTSYMDIIGVDEKRKKPTRENIKWFITDGHKMHGRMYGIIPLYFSALTLYKENISL